LGVDIDKNSKADIICNLELFPYPFKDDVFDKIICHSILEHLDDILGVMNELHRILKPEGVAKIITPHFSSLYSWDDPTHRHHFSSNSFDYFTPNASMTSRAEAKFEIVKKRIKFGKGFFDPFWEIFANKFVHYYERRLAFIFPAFDLHFELRAIK
jgi:SAM-dependent methyltransferase